MVPNQVYAGQRIDYYFDVMDVHDSSYTPSDHYPIEELSLDRHNCDWEGLMDYRTRLSKYTPGPLPAVVGLPNPTKSADVVTRFMTGYAYKRSTSQHCTYAGDECWYVRVHPKIESISASSGHTEGYQTLVIEGQGLSGSSTTVTVDSVDCEI